jgi:hypothetical protein
MLIVRRVFRGEVEKESQIIDSSAGTDPETPDYIDLEVTNPGCEGMALRDRFVPGLCRP